MGRKKKDQGKNPVQETDATVNGNEDLDTEIAGQGKTAKFKTTTEGKFVLPGIEFMPGKSIPVSADIAKTKKFKHAVKLGVLVKG